MDKTRSVGSNLTQSGSGTLVLLVAQLNLHTTHMLISIGPKYIMSHIQSILYCTWSAVDNIDTCCICWGSMFAMTSFPNFQTSPTTFHWQKIPRRVHQESLDTLTLGWQITELRRLAACNTYLGGWDVGEDMDGASRKGVLTNYDSLIFAIYIYIRFHVLCWCCDE